MSTLKFRVIRTRNEFFVLLACVTLSVGIFELGRLRRAIEARPTTCPEVVAAPAQEEMKVDPAKLQREALRRIYGKVRSFRSGLTDSLVYKIAGAVYEASTLHGVEEDVILAVIRVESWFDPNAVSNKGAIGLMQVMPFWAKVLPDCKNLYDVKTNVRCGTNVYLLYLEQFSDPDVALSAYNRGPRFVNYDIRRGVNPVQKYSKDVAMFIDQLKAWRDPAEQIRAASL